LAFCVLGCFFGSGFESFCGMRLLGLRLGWWEKKFGYKPFFGNSTVNLWDRVLLSAK
jgi:hypothetical protein